MMPSSNTMTPHERHGVSNNQQLQYLFNLLAAKLLLISFLWENPSMTDWFPSQRASNAESVSMSWRHHTVILSNNDGFWITLNTVMSVVTSTRQWLLDFRVYNPIVDRSVCLRIHMISWPGRITLAPHTGGEIQVLIHIISAMTLQWRHNEHGGVSNHRRSDCLFNHLFRRRSRKTSKRRVTGLYAGNSRVTGEFPAQRASNAENISIWCRHHGYGTLLLNVHLNRSNLCRFIMISSRFPNYWPPVKKIQYVCLFVCLFLGVSICFLIDVHFHLIRNEYIYWQIRHVRMSRANLSDKMKYRFQDDVIYINNTELFIDAGVSSW